MPGATMVPLDLITGDGTVAPLNTGVASGDVPLLDATGYPIADGSQITNIAGTNAIMKEADKTLNGAA